MQPNAFVSRRGIKRLRRTVQIAGYIRDGSSQTANDAAWRVYAAVLLAGAVRLGKPNKVVFVCKDANVDHQFHGWAYATDLLPHLVAAHPQYARSVDSAWAASRQWELVEPLDSPNPTDTVVPVPAAPPPWLSGSVSLARLEELFHAVLAKANIDLSWPAERSLKLF
jgi:hypothetical protein